MKGFCIKVFCIKGFCIRDSEKEEVAGGGVLIFEKNTVII